MSKTRFKQGYYQPINQDKYVGNPPIVYRSSWEKLFMKFLDLNPNVVKWNSEGLEIPYISEVDGLPHRYFPDFVVELINRDGKKMRYIIEIKPYNETLPPKQKKNKKTYMNECITYARNASKWDAAQAFASKHNFIFKIITEKELGI